MAADSGSKISDSFSGDCSCIGSLQISVAMLMGGGSESEHRPAYVNDPLRKAVRVDSNLDVHH